MKKPNQPDAAAAKATSQSILKILNLKYRFCAHSFGHLFIIANKNN